MAGPKTSLDYNDKSGRFIINAVPWDMERAKAIPNRRWDSKRRVWTAPAIRCNVEYIREQYRAFDTDITAAAKERILQAETKLKEMARVQNFPAWYKFKRPPRKGQMVALNAVYGLRASALVMEMRTGKTKVIIDEACALRMENKIDAYLLICPLNLVRNWMREFDKDATIPIDFYHLRTDDKGKSFEKWLHTKHDFKWLIVGVESLAAGSACDFVKKYLQVMGRVKSTVDESSKIKNHTANRSKRAVEFARMSEYRSIMTGTPTAQGPHDLFMQYEFLDPDIIGLGDFYSFRNRYLIMGGYENREIIGYQNMDELIEIITPFTFQLRQDEVLDIPAKVREIRTVKMTSEQRKLYHAMSKFRAIEDPDSNKSILVQNILEKILRLQQITGGSVAYAYSIEQVEEMKARGIKKPPKFWTEFIPGGNPKVDMMMELVEQYDGPTIVWCAYRPEIDLVVKALSEKYGSDQVAELHGGIDKDERDHNVYELYQKRRVRFIVGNAATGGMGLTMDVTENEIYFSNTHNYIDREQSEERGTGEGKPRGVRIIDILTEDTVDVPVFESNVMKKNVAEYVKEQITKARTRMETIALHDRILGGLTGDAAGGTL